MGSQLTKQLVRRIDDGVAMEQNVLRMLDSMIKTTSDPEIQRALETHKRTTREHAHRLEQRLKAYGTSPSRVKRVGGAVGGRAKGVLDLARRDKAGRNARDGFASEQMEIASYELLERVARKAGDDETVEVARQNRAEDEAMASKIAGSWDRFASLSLGETKEKGDGGGVKERASRVARLARQRPLLMAAGAVGTGLVLGRRSASDQASAGEDQEKPLGLLSKQELQQRASAAGITVRRSITKQELVEALESAGGSSSTPTANPIEVQTFLEGVGYPAQQQELVKHAEQRGADHTIRSTLERLPKKTFKTPAEVSEEIGKLG